MKKKLSIEIEKIEEIELFVSLLGLGITSALEKKKLSIDLAEQILFAPYMMKILKHFKVKKELIDMIHQGTEIGDIERLIPNNLDNAFQMLFRSSLKIIQEVSESKKSQSDRWIKLKE